MCIQFSKLLGTVLIFYALSACQKDFSYQRSRYNDMSLNGFFQEEANGSIQSFSLNATTGGTIRGKKGTGFSFQNLSFVDSNGGIIRGNVKIDVLEILTPSDMILNNAATMSDGLPLESGGAFYVNATYNNTKAKLAPGTFVKIDLVSPSASLPGMQVFRGYIQDSTGVGNQDTSGALNWVRNNNPGNIVTTDSITQNGIRRLFSDSLQWINCDRYMNEPKVYCSFQLENCPDKDSTAMFVQFTGRNSVMRIFQDSNDIFSSSMLVTGPVTVVGICIKDQKLYTSIIAVSLNAQQSFTMKFSEDTQEQLKQKLNSLK